MELPPPSLNKTWIGRLFGLNYMEKIGLEDSKNQSPNFIKKTLFQNKLMRLKINKYSTVWLWNLIVIVKETSKIRFKK